MTETEPKPTLKRVYDLIEAREHFSLTRCAPSILCINKRKNFEEKICETYQEAFEFLAIDEEEDEWPGVY